MGLGPSKCCKKPANEDEKTPLRGDHERGRDGVKAGFSGRRAGDRDGGDAREGLSLESPVDPDPGVFYAKPASKSSHSTDRSERTGRGGRCISGAASACRQGYHRRVAGTVHAVRTGIAPVDCRDLKIETPPSPKTRLILGQDQRGGFCVSSSLVGYLRSMDSSRRAIDGRLLKCGQSSKGSRDIASNA